MSELVTVTEINLDLSTCAVSDVHDHSGSAEWDVIVLTHTGLHQSQTS